MIAKILLLISTIINLVASLFIIQMYSDLNADNVYIVKIALHFWIPFSLAIVALAIAFFVVSKSYSKSWFFHTLINTFVNPFFWLTIYLLFFSLNILSNFRWITMSLVNIAIMYLAVNTYLKIKKGLNPNSF